MELLDQFVMFLGFVGFLVAILLVVRIWGDSERVAVTRTLEQHFERHEVERLMNDEEFLEYEYPELARKILSERD